MAACLVILLHAALEDMTFSRGGDGLFSSYY